MKIKKIRRMFILSILLFFITTCTDNNSPTNSSDRSLGKASDISDINSTSSSDPEVDSFDACYNTYYQLGLGLPGFSYNAPSADIYNFRDNYLSKSKKGKDYTSYYYELSKYGIRNNLVNKYYKEHLELLKRSTEIAHYLQYGSDDDNILISETTSENLKEMLKLYRSSINHKDIDETLNYLEADLQKYYDKPRTEIAAAFEQTK